MGEKNELYKKYVSDHLISRKGKLTLKKLKRKSIGHSQHFKSFLPKDKSVSIVDLGCGDGSLIYWLNSLGFQNTKGIDLSLEQVEIAKELKIQNVEVGDVFAFLKNENAFDVLFARDLLEHFDKKQILDFLSLCRSRLNDGGILILQIPNANSPFFGRIRYGDFTHEIAFTPSSLSQVLNNAGFKKTQFYPWYPIYFDLKSLVRFILWRLIEALIKIPILIETGAFKQIVTINLITVASK